VAVRPVRGVVYVHLWPMQTEEILDERARSRSLDAMRRKNEIYIRDEAKGGSERVGGRGGEMAIK